MGDRKTIALDCDGVLLDYSASYGRNFTRAFGIEPVEARPTAYWPMERWGIDQLSRQERDVFKAHFDEEFWGSLTPMPDALEACQRLVGMGFDLVCVTALDSRFKAAREENLRSLGFPLVEVITTGNEPGEQSPKAAALNAIKPWGFVDDFVHYFAGLDESIHKALIVGPTWGSPNTPKAMEMAHSRHRSLSEFVDWLDSVEFAKTA